MTTSPTGFADAGDQPVGRLITEANATDAELAIHGSRAATEPTTHPDADLVTRPQHFRVVALTFRLLDFRFMCFDRFQLIAMLRFFGVR
jgi:hypothetical protein